MDFGTAGREHLVQSLGLRDSARKTVEYHTCGVGMGVELVAQDVDHQIVGDQVSFGYVAVGYAAKLAPAGDVVAKQVACRYVVQTETVDQLFALGTLAAAGSPENYYVKHLSLA